MISEQGVDLLFEQHPDAMWVYDTETLAFLAVNEAAVRHYGYSRDEFLEMTIEAIRPPEDVARLREVVRSRGRGLRRSGLWRHRRKSGELIDVDVRGQSVTWADREAVLVCARDVTSLLDVQQEKHALLERQRLLLDRLEHADRHYRMIFEGLPGKYLILDPFDYVIVTASSDYLDATMSNRDSLRGRQLFEAFPAPEDASGIEAASALCASLKRVVATGESDVMPVQRYPIPRPEALGGGFEERYWSVVNTPIHDASGSMVFIVHRVEDLTEFVRAALVAEGDDENDASLRQEVLSRSRELRAANLKLGEYQSQLKMVQRLLKVAVCRLDLDTEEMHWSDSIEEILGLVPGTLAEMEACIHPDEREIRRREFDALLDAGETGFEFEHRVVRPDGDVRYLRGTAELAQGRSGSIMTGAVQDITERVTAEHEAKLREAREGQARKLETVGELTGGIAHDFNNLLTVMLGNAEMLQEALGDRPELHSLVNMMLSAAGRGAELTGRLLAFARRQPLEPRVLDVHQVLAGMDGLLRRTLSEDIEIEVIRGGGLWSAEVDPGQLELSLLNLAINARDAMPGGGRLTLETANAHLDDIYAMAHADLVAGHYVMVSVSDTGRGIPPGMTEQIFEPFFTTKEPGKGTGMGLSMVYGFVKQSGGHIKLYSEPGEGTTVKLYFPRSLQEATAMPELRRDAVAQGQGEHILAVEDDTLVRDQVVALLDGMGYRVTSAASGADAMRIIQGDEAIDLLFTDVIMPGGMNGRQLAEAACALRPGLRVLFTSGYTENAIVHHGRLDPGVQLLSKPYRRAELAAKVRKVLCA